MNKVIIDKNIESFLRNDPIAQVEKVFGKHYSEFTQEENLMMLANAMHTNKIKNDYLSSLGDTHFGMKWDEFISIIKGYGFKKGLKYDFKHGDGKYTDEAILYYHPEKGLVIWATSYANKSSVNGGKLYGQVKTSEQVEYETIKNQWGERDVIKYTDSLKAASESLNGCSHGAFMDIETGVDFNIDIREALINKLEMIGVHLEFVKVWTKDQFLWFLDFTEENQPDYDYKDITKEKISKCPSELQNILNIYQVK